jgi:phospholipid/cholesterol/gamma-HCH transport system ATP-binding protein
MRRRVAIARAIVGKPDLLLYDSPTGGLDPITSTNIIELVMKQRDVNHTSSLLITHRLQDAFILATHQFNSETNHMEESSGKQGDINTSFLILHDGKLVFDGSTHDLVASKDPFIKDYLR